MYSFQSTFRLVYTAVCTTVFNFSLMSVFSRVNGGWAGSPTRETLEIIGAIFGHQMPFVLPSHCQSTERNTLEINALLT